MLQNIYFFQSGDVKIIANKNKQQTWAYEYIYFLFVVYHQMVPAPEATLINYICGVSIILICDH